MASRFCLPSPDRVRQIANSPKEFLFLSKAKGRTVSPARQNSDEIYPPSPRRSGDAAQSLGVEGLSRPRRGQNLFANTNRTASLTLTFLDSLATLKSKDLGKNFYGSHRVGRKLLFRSNYSDPNPLPLCPTEAV
jgi:hypothetical protein